MTKLIALGCAAVVVGTALFAWSTSYASRPTLPAVSAFSVEQIQRGIDAKGLPETEMHDMTFIFVENE
jgi:hypothetical protein